MVSELLGGAPDLVLECAGVPKTIDQSVELVLALALAELSACFAELVASPTDMKVLVDPNL